MRRAVPFALLTLLLLSLTPSLQAQDVSGTWELTSTTQRGERTITVTLTQDGPTVTGTALMPMMGRGGGAGAGGAPREVEISEGTFENGTLTFSITMGMGERSLTQTYVASAVTETTMEGTITGSLRAGDPIPFKGVKKEAF